MKYSPILILLLLSCSVNGDNNNDRASIFYPIEVIDYVAAPGFYTENKTFSIAENIHKLLGFPKGGGTYGADNSSIVTLGGAGGYIVVKFDPPILNIPNYYDFIVFGNAIWMGGNPETPNMEPGFVEVKESNSNEWYLLLPEENRAHTQRTSVTYKFDGEQPDLVLQTWESTNNYLNKIGYTEVTPTLKKPGNIANKDFYTIPDTPGDLSIDEKSGGGDAFKLEWAVDENLNPVILDKITYIKITTGVYRDGGYTFGGIKYNSETEVDSIIRVKDE